MPPLGAKSSWQRRAKSSWQRRAQILALGAAALMLAVTLWVALTPSRPDQGLGYGAYQLSATDGSQFTQAALKGGPTLVFFGYTNCPDVCPTTLGDIAQWQDSLGPEAKRLKVVLITVDPERDSLPVLTQYLSWTEGVIGATGSRAQIDTALAAFHVYARKVDTPSGHADHQGYSVEHTASVALFDRSGRLAGKIAYQEPLEQVLPKLRALLAS